jgi:hypothetical protein
MGNPVGLFTKVAGGFYQLVNDPLEGAKKDGKEGFKDGLVSGMQVAVRDIFGGLSNAFATTSGSIY